MDGHTRSWSALGGTDDRLRPGLISVHGGRDSGDSFVGKLQRDRSLWERVQPSAEGEASCAKGRPCRDWREHAKKRTPLFPDPDAMKARLREQMSKPEYNVSDFYHEAGVCQCVARSQNFEKLGLAFILLNAVWIGVDAELNSAEVLSEAAWPFVLAENVFCVFFCSEFLLRFCAFRQKRDCLQDGSFVFDAVLALVMALETWVMPVLQLSLAFRKTSGVVRMFRLVRLSRMARMARLLRTMPELLILVKGMLSAVRSVFFTLCLLGLLTYVFSITFKTLAAGTASGQEFFPSLPVAMHTLVLHGTLLDELTTLVNMLRHDAVHSEAWHLLGLLYLYVLLSALTLMNMLIGVVCEVVSAVAAAEKEEIMFGGVRDKLQQIMQTGAGGIDKDGDNLISKEEFRAMLENHEAARCLHEVGVDVVGLVDIADFIFEDHEAVDGSGDPSERLLTFGEFMEVILGLRGSNVATVKDIVDLRKYVRTSISLLRQDMSVRGHEAAETASPGRSNAPVAELQEKLRASELRVRRLEEELRLARKPGPCAAPDRKTRTDVACGRQAFSFDPLAALKRLSPPPPLVRGGPVCGAEESAACFGPACSAESSNSRGPTLSLEFPAPLARCQGDEAEDGPEEGPEDGLSLDETLSGIYVEFSAEAETKQESTGLTAASTGTPEEPSSTESAAFGEVFALGRAGSLTGGPADCVDLAQAAEVQIEMSCDGQGDHAMTECDGRVYDPRATISSLSTGLVPSADDSVTSMKVTL